MTETPLFPGYEPPPQPEAEPLSAGRRLTQRQAAYVGAGIHPLTRGPLHPLASRHRDASAPKDDPFTCGSCYFRETSGYHDRSYPKCLLPGPVRAHVKRGDEWRWETVDGYPRVSHSTTSDVRAWWPACPDYSPGDSLSPDAARSIPEATP